jgi:phospholipase/carboxylesterase
MTDFSLHHAVLPARVGEGPHPGLLLLHGRGTNEHDLLPLAAEFDDRLFTVSARGPLNFPYGGHAWYELDPRGVGYPTPESIGATLDALDCTLDEILAAYPIDPRRLYVAGFSMGGAMASALMLLYPERVAGGVILSSYLPLHADLPFKTDAVNSHPIFQAHGVADGVIPVTFGRETRDFLQTTPVELTYREYPMAHAISPAELTDLQGWWRSVLDREPEVS